MQLRIICGDITTWPAQAIVNSASESLMSTGGLDNRIYQAGGISLRAACSSLGGCPEGKAVLTFGYKLPARYVIHTVAPFWRGGGHHEESQLLSCYRASLALAREREVHHLAFSSLGTADKRIPLNRRFPSFWKKDLAFRISTSSVKHGKNRMPTPRRLFFTGCSRSMMRLKKIYTPYWKRR